SVEFVACQSDVTEMVNAPVFPISRCGRKRQESTLPVRRYLIPQNRIGDDRTANQVHTSITVS
ncbi:hypothetical protein ACCT04_35790, partial [Rhizobium ruizarguesonis]